MGKHFAFRHFFMAWFISLSRKSNSFLNERYTIFHLGSYKILRESSILWEFYPKSLYRKLYILILELSLVEKEFQNKFRELKNLWRKFNGIYDMFNQTHSVKNFEKELFFLFFPFLVFPILGRNFGKQSFFQFSTTSWNEFYAII